MASATSIDSSIRADILAEAIPFIRRFTGKAIVIKYGGNVLHGLDESAALSSFAQDIVLLRSVGILPIVIHGGGPQIGFLMERLGKVPEFRDGLRVTDAETLDIARMVLVGKVNRDIVGSINVHGPLAVGLSGEDAGFIVAEARNPSLGFVGDVVAVDPTLINNLIAQGLVPVVATIGSDATGQAYNINADTVAGAIAESVGCEKLIFLTDVTGILRNRDDIATLVHRCTADQLLAMMGDGIIGEGMIPKASACAAAVRNGVTSAHILDGRIAHAALLELLTEQGVGTMVTES
jgi:acetylglutamate kinase